MKFKLIIFLAVVSVLVAGIFFGFQYWKSGSWKQLVFDQVGTHFISDEKQLNLFQELLGFEKPQTYLVLFLNNTEIRPGGGFIGTYAVVKVDKGSPELLKTEGTEILDYSTPGNDLPAPPAPIKEQLLVDKWYFRDSNWSPDFRLSSEKSLELYRLEKGLEANNITGVVAFTPTLIEKLLDIVGPITVRGEEFNSKNFLEKTQYEVEYGFAPKGVARAERKGILGDMAKVLIGKLPAQIFSDWKTFYALWEQMVTEKQIMFYSTDSELQNVFKTQNWSGEILNTTGDYLLWADANLGAMKTDLAITRTLSYEIVPTSSGKYLAKVSMNYEHSGSFDWRTTRYRSYARVYVPEGSKLVSAEGAMEKDKSTKPGKVDSGRELNREWFGAFVSIEPGKTRKLSFTYLLPDKVGEQIKNGQYNLFVQKQLGIISTDLKLKLDFGKLIKSASPGEDKTQYGDNVYELTKKINSDSEFIVKF